MPVPRLKPSELANKHLPVTLKQQKTIYAISKKEKRKTSEVVTDMINAYVSIKTDKLYNADTSYLKFSIS